MVYALREIYTRSGEASWFNQEATCITWAKENYTGHEIRKTRKKGASDMVWLRLWQHCCTVWTGNFDSDNAHTCLTIN